MDTAEATTVQILSFMSRLNCRFRRDAQSVHIDNMNWFEKIRGSLV